MRLGSMKTGSGSTFQMGLIVLSMRMRAAFVMTNLAI